MSNLTNCSKENKQTKNIWKNPQLQPTLICQRVIILSPWISKAMLTNGKSYLQILHVLLTLFPLCVSFIFSELYTDAPKSGMKVI